MYESRLQHTLLNLGRRVLGSRQINHLVRFDPLLKLIGETADGGTLLDVGSGSQGITSLLGPGWHTTMVDADFEDYGAAPSRAAVSARSVVGDVRALPFSDHAFDIVIASDLLEHVAPPDRAQAVGEICRVASKRAIIACPAGDAALEADRRLAGYLRAGRRDIPPWLTEHLDNGFPERAQIEAAARPHGAVRLLDNENVSAHVRLVRAELRPLPAVVLRLLCRPLELMLVSRRGRTVTLARGILRAIRGGDRAPVYRTVATVDIGLGRDHPGRRHSLE
jgi:SAM-dependent methyltransferase